MFFLNITIKKKGIQAIAMGTEMNNRIERERAIEIKYKYFVYHKLSKIQVVSFTNIERIHG